MSLRTRILLSFAPLIVLLAVLGGVGLVQLDRTGGRIDAILRENYASVQAMSQLNEALERIDSAFQFALSGQRLEKEAKEQFVTNRRTLEDQFRIEENNITVLPLERELVDRLRPLKDDYLRRGERFFSLPPGSVDRSAAYHGESSAGPGLLKTFQDIKTVAGEITRINQENMEQARDDARATARAALVGCGLALVALAALVFGIAGYILRSILGPIQAVTEAAQAIGESRGLDREVPVFGRDELGRLATAFNTMTRQLREYRLSNLGSLMRAQKTAQSTIDSFPDPIVVVDPDGRVELANPPARGLLGIATTPGGEPNPVWPPPDALRQPIADALRVQKAYQPEGFDQVVTFRFGGEDRTYLPQVRPIRDPEGNTLGAAVVLDDVTRFRMLDQFKSDLVATVSHELKTPLTSVRLAVHVLLEEAVGPLTPKQAELLLDARDSSERLLAMIEQMLALAKLQRPQDETTFRPEDPVPLLRRAADAVRPRAEDKHVAVVVIDGAPLPPVAVDPVRMDQALGNLLTNAITYTPSGGRVTLSAAVGEPGRVTLTVADTGVGIPAEHMPHVFDRFFRIPGQRDETGTGLGLSIVKEVVTAHKGEIGCTSEPGAGTTFRITLPVAAEGSP